MLGIEHPGTLMRMACLARTYANMGNLKEAEQLEVRVLDMRKKMLGAENPHVLESMNNLYLCQGKWNEAEQLEVQMLDMSKKVLGAEHPDTIRSMANLARTYANKGNLKEAEQLDV